MCCAVPKWQWDPRVSVVFTAHRWDYCVRLGISATTATSFIEVAGRMVVLAGSYAISGELAR